MYLFDIVCHKLYIGIQTVHKTQSPTCITSCTGFKILCILKGFWIPMKLNISSEISGFKDSAWICRFNNDNYYGRYFWKVKDLWLVAWQESLTTGLAGIQTVNSSISLTYVYIH